MGGQISKAELIEIRFLLTHFVKHSQKTPKRELTKAKRYLKDYLERNM